MFDLTDDVENSPYAKSPSKAKPAEVKPLFEVPELKGEKLIVKEDKDVPSWKDKKNDDYNEYEYSDDPEEDDKNW